MLSRLKVITIILSLIQCSYCYFVIEQCPGTDVPNIRQQKEFYEVSLIFYYTRWSDESLEALKYFNDVASIFEDNIYFASIDCWHLSCNCSNTLSTAMGSGYPHKWPTLMVYYGRGGQLKIQYNGLFTFRHLLNFIMNIMHPLERIERREDLERIMTSTDGIVLGVFENPKTLEYKHYLVAALKWLEYDPIRTYRFFITFSNAKENINKSNIMESNLLLFSQKSRKSFADYNHFKWNISTILRWLHEEFNDDYSNLHGYSTPITIAQKLKKQPVLAVFVNEPQKFFTYMEKYVDKEKPFSKDLLTCQSAKKRKLRIKNSDKHLQNSIMQHLALWDDFKCFYKRDTIIKNLKFYYEINQYLEQQKQVYFEKNVNSEVNELLDFFLSIKCLQKNDITLETSLHVSVVKKLENYLANEQQCKMSNRTLSVVLLDAERYKDYLENLKITTTHQSMATVFIVDNDKENIYLMEDRFAMFNLMEFVKVFHLNGLYNYFKNKEIIPATPYSQISREYDIVLKEFNRDVFLKSMQHIHNQTLVVLIYSPDCALCGNIEHSFMQLSLLLQNIVDLKFIRINAMDNDLPWQFNMPFLPALLVFPEHRFSESRLFPTQLKPDIRNVFGFVISQLSANQQVRLVVAMCQSETLPKSHIPSCWQYAKTILMQHIGKHLQYWQIFEAERILIFERLRAFKDLSLDVQRNLR